MAIIRFTSAIAAAILLFSAGVVLVTPLGAKEARQMDTFPLVVNGTDAKANFATLGSYDVSFFQDAAWIGKVKNEATAEPLLLYGDNYLAFKQYLLKNPNSYQTLYVYPGVTAPVGFSVPHSFPPYGVLATGFGFSKEGVLELRGQNKFIACPSTNAANPHAGSYQIWWNGNGAPQGAGCLTDIQLVKGS